MGLLDSFQITFFRKQVSFLRKRAQWLISSAQNASLDNFYAHKTIGGWTQGVRCLDYVTRKDGLALTVQWARRIDPAALGCIPASFVLPRDRESWGLAASAARSAWWIAKPANSSNSDGIRLLSGSEASTEFAPSGNEATSSIATARLPVTVLQQYVPRPALIGGLKFDLRLYVLVLQCGTEAPTALLYSDGLARFATTQYACPAGVEGPAGAAHAPAAAAELQVGPPLESPPPVLRAHLTNYVRTGYGYAAG